MHNGQRGSSGPTDRIINMGCSKRLFEVYPMIGGCQHPQFKITMVYHQFSNAQLAHTSKGDQPIS